MQVTKHFSKPNSKKMTNIFVYGYSFNSFCPFINIGTMDIYEEVTSAAYVHLKSFNPKLLIPLRKCREENLDLEVSSPSGDIFSI